MMTFQEQNPIAGESTPCLQGINAEVQILGPRECHFFGSFAKNPERHERL